MNYKDTDFHDHIADHICENCGERMLGMRSLKAAESDPVYQIYGRLLKTDYDLNENFGCSIAQLIALLMLHYGSMTNKQFSRLGIGNARYLYTMRQNSSHSYGQYKIESLTYDKYNKAYVLKESTVRELLEFLPAEYALDNHFPDIRKKKIAEHDVTALDCVYDTIADPGMKTFLWHQSPFMYYGRNVHDSLKEYYGPSCSWEPESYFVPDGIMEFAGGTGGEHTFAFVEHDMSTENAAKMNEKHQHYGSFFKDGTNAALSTVIYDTALSAEKLRNLRPAKKDTDGTLKTAGRYISIIADMPGIENLKDVADYCTAQEAEGRGKHGRTYIRTGKYLSVIACLNALSQATGRELSELNFDDFKAYAASVDKEGREKNNDSVLARLERRNRFIEGNILTYIQEDENLLLPAILSGLSYVVCTEDYFNTYKQYILAGASLQRDMITDRVINELFSDFDEYRYEAAAYGTIRTGTEKYVLKNRIKKLQADSGNLTAAYYVEEISADVGARIRVANFLKNFRGGKVTTHLILLIADNNDAISMSENMAASEGSTVRVTYINYTDAVRTGEYAPFEVQDKAITML